MKRFSLPLFLIAFIGALVAVYFARVVIALGVLANNGIPDEAFAQAPFVERGIEKALFYVGLLSSLGYSVLRLARLWIFRQRSQS